MKIKEINEQKEYTIPNKDNHLFDDAENEWINRINTAGVTLGASSPYLNHTFEAIKYIEAGLKNKNTISEVKKYLDKLVRQMDKNNTNVIEVAKGLLYREMIKGKSKLSWK